MEGSTIDEDKNGECLLRGTFALLGTFLFRLVESWRRTSFKKCVQVVLVLPWV